MQGSFIEIPIKTIISLMESKGTLVISSVNYEERSLTFLNSLLSNRNQLLAKFILFVFRSLQDNVYPLEIKKDWNTHCVENWLKERGVNYKIQKIPYPMGFYKERIKSNLQFLLQESDFSDIVLDITAIPRTVLFSILESIRQIQKERKTIHNLYLVYTTPLKYSIYPHEIGSLETYFSKSPLHELFHYIKTINLIIVPGIYGNEINVLIEDLKKNSAKIQNVYLLIPMYKHDLFTFIKILKMSPNIITTILSLFDNSRVYYCFSFHHTMGMLLDIVKKLIINRDEGCLIAPFNAKPIAVSAFYAYTYLTEKGVWSDVLRMSSVQYSSFYSIGTGEMFCWKVNVDGG
jgi:hypothetical protein